MKIDNLKKQAYIAYTPSEHQSDEEIILNMVCLYDETGIEVRSSINGKEIKLNDKIMSQIISSILNYKPPKTDTQP